MPELNILGMPIVASSGEAPKEEPKVEEKKDEIDYSKIDISKIDITKHPEFVRIQQENEEKGRNLSGQGEKIKRLERERAKATAAAQAKPVFENIRTSKDLTAAERESMTEAEIKNMDQIAAMQKAMNEGFSYVPDDQNGDEGEDDRDDDVTTVDPHPFIQKAAMTCANGDWMKANQLIEKFNVFGFDVTKIKSDKDAMDKFALVIAGMPEFVPKKEQGGVAPGGAVKGSGKADDFGSLIDDVAKERAGNANGTYRL